MATTWRDSKSPWEFLESGQGPSLQWSHTCGYVFHTHGYVFHTHTCLG